MERKPLLGDAGGHWVRWWTSDEWFGPADAWVREQLATAGMVVSGDPVPYKIRFWAAVWCYPTDHGLFWFKENNPGQSFEAALVEAMARALPQHVVAPLAVDHDRGWMLTPDQGSTLDSQVDDADLGMWHRLVTEYAALQRDTIPVGDTLLTTGLTEIAPSKLTDTVHTIADWYGGLAKDHPLQPDPAILDGVRRAADALAGFDSRLSGAVPLALDQNDLHARNVLRPDPNGPFRFFDFGDAVWGHPFVTLAGLRTAVGDKWTDQLETAYLEEWTDLAPLDILRRELQTVMPLHVVHRMVPWHRLLVHADDIEAAAWAEYPRQWLQDLAGLDVRT